MANTDPMAILNAMMKAATKAAPAQSYTVPNPCAIAGSGSIIPVSGSLNWSSIQHPQPWSEESLVAQDKEAQEEAWSKMGNHVLSNVEAHTTVRIGELAEAIHRKISILRASVSMTNAQWTVFAELISSITDLIGDPYEHSNDANLPSHS